MATDPKPGKTDFTLDVLGRYICNGLDEARRSANKAAPRPDDRPQIEARDFDLIVIGGGSFGPVVAEHMGFRDKSRAHRILVLEAGPLVLGEHVQNLPILDLNQPDPTSIKELRRINEFGPDKPRREVWGLPWHSSTPFTGLAYCLGGRSIYFGGWSPELLASELPIPSWPAAVVADLTNRYFREASDQIGTSETNDFIFGDLHRALRQQLFNNIGTVTDVAPLAGLPDHPAVRYAAAPPTAAELAALLGVPAGAINAANAKNMLKLEAPLAVQGRSGHAGFFPFNKFSSVPLLVKAAREAYAESRASDGSGDDARKPLMIVPKCHVNRLVMVQDGGAWRVTTIETNQGDIPVPADGKVIVALGTIESARLVKNALMGKIPQDAWDRIGTNLMGHLRSNLNIRIPRTALATLPAAAQGLQASALFVKGRHTFPAAIGGGAGHFHLQITASGLGAIGGDSEAELFKKIPDIDTYDAHRNASDTHIAITIRGIGEMQPGNDVNWVRLDNETEEEFGNAQRALVSLPNPADVDKAAHPLSAKDEDLWGAMDQAIKDVATIFGVAAPPAPVRDAMGTTHHEAGTLYLGEAGSTSVTLPDCRVRHTTNIYAAGPALFPTIGSPNPMLTGVALARRLGDQLATPTPDAPDAGFNMLFDGVNRSAWRMTTIRNQAANRSNPGRMRVIDGALETVAGNDMGVYWCTTPTPPNFILRLQWLRWTEDANSGVYLRFPNPEGQGYNNTAYVPDDFGFEVQIDETGAPDGQPIHRTGAIYRKDNRVDNEVLNQQPARGVGQWNDFEIRVDGQQYTVRLNGHQVCAFDNAVAYPGRGLASAPGAPSFIGLQVYPNPRHFVRFRRIQIQAI